MIEDHGSVESGGDEHESRLARWSRRKAEQQSLQKALDTPEQVLRPDLPQASQPVDEAAAAAEPELPAVTDADMPPVESLNSGSDFSGFMSPGVSEELRKLALRKMFSLPSFQIRDGLDDYDDDYTIFEPLGDTVTSDPWTHRQKRLAEERAAANKAEANELERERKENEIADDDAAEDEVVADEVVSQSSFESNEECTGICAESDLKSLNQSIPENG